MRLPRFTRLSLLWKILLSTSVAITALFTAAGWMVLHDALETTTSGLEEEVQASFQAYRSLWQSRAEKLASMSLILSAMSDVRSAFSTGDQATIRDTAGELWARVSEENALFLVTDPKGKPIASLSGVPDQELWGHSVVVPAAAKRFPRQTSGIIPAGGYLYQVAVTPVYVQSGRGLALLNVLVAGNRVDALVAQRLKEATGGSEFLFLSGGEVMASTLNPRATTELARKLAANPAGSAAARISDGVNEYAPLMTPLEDIEGKPIGQLWILRSFENARQRLAVLRRNMILLGLAAVLVGLALTYLLARKIVRPVETLDRAAAEVSRQNYGYRVPVEGLDELGRLAQTFNDMCTSIQNARQELIRQERISTIGRLSSSIVHDLRNPLAAIYGGSEMLVDSDLAPAQVKRLAANLYRASRRIQELLQDLVNVGRGKTEGAEICRLGEVATAAVESLTATAEAQNVSVLVDVPDSIELPLERARMERVFINLMSNALEAMPAGGAVRIAATLEEHAALVEVSDNGPGIAPQVQEHMFQPFGSSGKKDGLGLGLALSRQTVLDHGGDMWVESKAGQGAHFFFRLPLEKPAMSAARQVASSLQQV
jgi:signal transduction histidine kinase